MAFFSLNQMGVFGNTFVGLTLNSNKSLENGLVGHWTFDSSDVDGFQVLDRSGNNNHGNIIATSSVGSEVEFDDRGDSLNYLISTAPMMVWTDDQTGYVFYYEQNGNDTSVSSTTDGGATWSGRGEVVNGGSKAALWYDQWTPNDSGSMVHVLTWISSELYYAQYDTSNDTVSTPVQISSTGGSIVSTAQYAITKAEDGTLVAVAPDNDGGIGLVCSSNCTNGASWTSTANPYRTDENDQVSALVPVAGTNNVLLVYHNETADSMDENIYSATSSSWWGAREFISSIPNFSSRLQSPSLVVHPSTGKTYLAFPENQNDYTCLLYTSPSPRDV